ncbi:MAG: hypothetical protein WC380_12685, partial [Pedobacter sp.]
MDKLKILVTGAGAPGIAGTIYSLQNNFDNRPVEIIGTDCNPDAVGKDLCDSFYHILKSDTEFYLCFLKALCNLLKIDLIIPQNTGELLILSIDKIEFSCPIMVSNYLPIKYANDKSIINGMNFKNFSSFYPGGCVTKIID